MLCPSNQPFRNAHKPRMKFVQKIGPTVFQYKCKDCGSLTNLSMETEEVRAKMAAVLNPTLVGKKMR